MPTTTQKQDGRRREVKQQRRRVRELLQAVTVTGPLVKVRCERVAFLERRIAAQEAAADAGGKFDDGVHVQQSNLLNRLYEKLGLVETAKKQPEEDLFN